MYMYISLPCLHVYYCYNFYVIIQYEVKLHPCHFKADGLFNIITYYNNLCVYVLCTKNTLNELNTFLKT